jgi:hypothetical protein
MKILGCQSSNYKSFFRCGKIKWTIYRNEKIGDKIKILAA